MKNVVLILIALSLAACSTLDAVQSLADATRQKPAAQPSPAPAAEPASAPQKPASQAGQDSNSSASAASLEASRADWARYSNLPPSGKSFGAGDDLSAAAPASLASVKAGQWAAYRNLEKGQLKGIIKMAVVSQNGDTWIYEFVSITEKETVVLQEAVKGLDAVVRTGDADQGTVVWIKVRDKDGKVQTLDGVMLGMAGAGYKNMITANAARFNGTVVAGGPVTVPAGSFASTWKVDSRVAQGRGSEAATAWVSTLVPLWHVVKSVGQSGQVLELVDFGTTGYKSALE